MGKGRGGDPHIDNNKNGVVVWHAARGHHIVGEDERNAKWVTINWGTLATHYLAVIGMIAGLTVIAKKTKSKRLATVGGLGGSVLSASPDGGELDGNALSGDSKPSWNRTVMDADTFIELTERVRYDKSLKTYVNIT